MQGQSQEEEGQEEYNGEDNSALLKLLNQGAGMKIGFESYINGEMRPTDYLVRKLK